MISTVLTYQRYFDDPICLKFTAQVLEIATLPADKFGIVLPETYFYPTSGGQEHDTGTIGDAKILDVIIGEDGRIVHIADRNMVPGSHPAEIDHERRMRAMQHHTAQHILSGAFEHLFNLRTVSANINGYHPSTIDLASEFVPPSDLTTVEDLANEIVFSNRRVKSYFVNDTEIERIPFRRPPKVSGTIRVIEIDQFDTSACGGTHCPQTGMVGLIKILHTEKVNKKLRIHFIAGYQSVEIFRDYQYALYRAGEELDIRPEEVGNAVLEQQERLRQLQSEIVILREQLLDIQAERCKASAIEVEGIRLITGLVQDLIPTDLRNLGKKSCVNEASVAVLGVYQGKKLSLVTACSKDTGIDARELLKKHLAFIDGRGGGDASLAQGGGECDQSALARLFTDTPVLLKQCL